MIRVTRFILMTGCLIGNGKLVNRNYFHRLGRTAEILVRLAKTGIFRIAAS